jgi:hypothetical protein
MSMRRGHYILTLSAALAIGGCSGNVELVPLDPTTMGNPRVVHDVNAEPLDQSYHGVVVYLPTQVLEIDRFTQIQTLAPDNKTLILSGACDPSNATIQKVVTVVDRAHPYLLQYHHGLLETYTFGATLTSDGALAGINTSSTPDQGKTLANLSAAAVSAGSLARLTATPRHDLPCTQTPSFVRYDPLPKISPGSAQ